MKESSESKNKTSVPDQNKEIWESALEIIKEDTEPIQFTTWFEPLSIRRIDDDLRIVYLEVHSGKGMDLILKNVKERYMHYLENAFKIVLRNDYKVVIKTSEDYREDDLQKSQTRTVRKNREIEKIFNPKYTFENFVVGDSNKYAHAAAFAAAESPSDVYNPIFIYGGSGLGKTHLMHAIGTYILRKNPKLDVLYVSSEMFTNDFVSSLHEGKMEEFKSKYRKVDVLLIDDIQFIEGKERIQEEFFYTFEDLYNLNKQIIISSDKNPDQLKTLSERLKTRLQSNIVADIQPPDYELRVAILMKKAQNMNIKVDDDLKDVIWLIADNIKDNIRELEGAFTRIVSFSTLMNIHIDERFAKETLKDILKNNEIQITPEKVKNVISKHYGIKISDLESQKRTNSLAYPRQIAMYLIREMTDLSLPQIGTYFGGKHHTTVKYACEKIEHDIKHDVSLRDTINNLRDKIRE